MAASGPVNPMIAKGPNGEEIDISKWVQMYPCYIDANKSLKQGRKVPKEACLNCAEIDTCCGGVGRALCVCCSQACKCTSGTLWVVASS